MVKSLVGGIHFLKTHKAETMKSIATFMKLQDPKALDEIYQQYTRLLPRAPYPTAAGVRTILDDLTLKHPKARTAKPEEFIKPRFVEEPDYSGHIRCLYGQ